MNDSALRPRFSEGQDESTMMAELKKLVKNGWKLDENEMGVQKTYHLKNYTKVTVGDSVISQVIPNIHRNFITVSQ